MNTLPHELVLIIGNRLYIRDRVRLYVVCKKMLCLQQFMREINKIKYEIYEAKNGLWSKREFTNTVAFACLSKETLVFCPTLWIMVNSQKFSYERNIDIKKYDGEFKYWIE
jgi:hypothetical protein